MITEGRNSAFELHQTGYDECSVKFRAIAWLLRRKDGRGCRVHSGGAGPGLETKVERDGANPSQPTCTTASHSRQRPCAPARWPSCTGRKLPTTLTEGPCAESPPGPFCPPVQPRPHTMTREILLWIPFGQNLHPFSPNAKK